MRDTLSTTAWWFATFAWATLIFHLSTPAFGADRSIPILARLLAFFHVLVSPPTLDLLDTFIRKLAHLTEYAILALFLYRSFYGSRTLHAAPPDQPPAQRAIRLGERSIRAGGSCPLPARSPWRPRLAFCCVVIAGLYSVTDEFHQSFTPNRVASALDCLLDTTGAAAGMLFTYLSVHFSGQRATRITLLTASPTLEQDSR